MQKNEILPKSKKGIPKRLFHAGYGILNKRKSVIDSEITLFSNKMSYFQRGIKSLECSRILLKGTTEKINSEEEQLLSNFLGSSAKSILIPLGLMVAASTTDAAIEKTITDQE